MKDAKKLSIAIPCFNEFKNITMVLTKFSDLLKNRYDIEVLVVDGASTDETPRELEKIFEYLDPQKFKLILKETRGGYGHDIMYALSQASGDVLSWTHADLQTDPYDVMRAFDLYLSAEKDHIFVKGERKNRRFIEFFFTFSMQIVVWFVLKKYLSDINAQPKLFSRQFYDKYLKKDYPLDFSLDLYALYQARASGYKIRTLPVEFRKRLYGEAKGGGGGWKSRIQLIKRTFKYIFKLKAQLKIF